MLIFFYLQLKIVINFVSVFQGLKHINIWKNDCLNNQLNTKGASVEVNILNIFAPQDPFFHPKSRPPLRPTLPFLEFLQIMNKLDQVYCAWLINWVVKWEIFKLTELCLTRWLIISGTWWYWVSIWRYWLVLDQYKLVLLDIRWYRVSKGPSIYYVIQIWGPGRPLPP